MKTISCLIVIAASSALNTGMDLFGQEERRETRIPFAKVLTLPSTLLQNAKQIGLSEEQLETFQNLSEKANRESAELLKRSTVANQQLMELLSSDKIEKSTALRALDGVVEFEKENKKARLAALIEINNRLKPEQRKIALELQSALIFEHPPEQLSPMDRHDQKTRMRAKLKKIRDEIETRRGSENSVPVHERDLLRKFRELMKQGRPVQAEKILDQLIEKLNLDQSSFSPGFTKRAFYAMAQERSNSADGYESPFFLEADPMCKADPSLPWVREQVTGPGIEFHVFESKTACTTVSFHLYKPDAYDANPTQRFPVLYWLHGTQGMVNGIRPVAMHFDSAIQNGKIPPMLVVFVNGLPCRLWSNSKDGTAPVENVFIHDLIPHVDSTFRTIADRNGRILEGFSMGGYGTARFALKHPGTFARASMLASGPLDPEFMGPLAQANPRLRQKILDLVCNGDLDCFMQIGPTNIFRRNVNVLNDFDFDFRQVIGELDAGLRCNEEFHKHLLDGNFGHDWIVIPDVAHEPAEVLSYLMQLNPSFYDTSSDSN